MTAEAFYRYLIQARRALWASLRTLSDEDLSRPLVATEGARCIKDLVMHVPVVEDGWFRGDLLGVPLVQDTLGMAPPRSADAYWHQQGRPLDDLLRYWEAVEADTLRRWPELMAADQTRRIPVDESRPETISADEVLWHVMGHEVRHTAQIVQMIQLLGHKPPSLDLVFMTAKA